MIKQVVAGIAIAAPLRLVAAPLGQVCKCFRNRKPPPYAGGLWAHLLGVDAFLAVFPARLLQGPQRLRISWSQVVCIVMVSCTSDISDC